MPPEKPTDTPTREHQLEAALRALMQSVRECYGEEIRAGNRPSLLILGPLAKAEALLSPAAPPTSGENQLGSGKYHTRPIRGAADERE